MKLHSILALTFVAAAPAVLVAQTPNDSASATAKARVVWAHDSANAHGMARSAWARDSASLKGKARAAWAHDSARTVRDDSARTERGDSAETERGDSGEVDSTRSGRGLSVADSAKARVTLHHGAHVTRGVAVGIDNRPVTPATPAVPATRATVGSDGTVTAAVPAKPATPASPASVGVGVTTGGSASTHRPSDPGQSGGRRP